MSVAKPYPPIGIPELDAEHQALGATLRRVLKAMSEDDRAGSVALGRELVERAEAHFRHEEALMREIGYARRLRHARAHADFVAEAKRELRKAVTHGLSVDVLRWAGHLDQWFHNHVVTEDLWLAHALQRARSAEALPAK